MSSETVSSPMSVPRAETPSDTGQSSVVTHEFTTFPALVETPSDMGLSLKNPEKCDPSPILMPVEIVESPDIYDQSSVKSENIASHVPPAVEIILDTDQLSSNKEENASSLPLQEVDAHFNTGESSTPLQDEEEHTTNNQSSPPQQEVEEHLNTNRSSVYEENAESTPLQDEHMNTDQSPVHEESASPQEVEKHLMTDLDTVQSSTPLDYEEEQMHTVQSSTPLDDEEEQMHTVQSSTPLHDEEEHTNTVQSSTPLQEVEEHTNSVQPSTPLHDEEEQMHTVQSSTPLHDEEEHTNTVQSSTPLQEVEEHTNSVQPSTPLHDEEEHTNTVQSSTPLHDEEEHTNTVQSSTPLQEVEEHTNTVQSSTPLHDEEEHTNIVQSSTPLHDEEEHMNIVQSSTPLHDEEEHTNTVQSSTPLHDEEEHMNTVQSSTPLHDEEEHTNTVQSTTPLHDEEEHTNTVQSSTPLHDEEEHTNTVQSSTPLHDEEEHMNIVQSSTPLHDEEEYTNTVQSSTPLHDEEEHTNTVQSSTPLHDEEEHMNIVQSSTPLHDEEEHTNTVQSSTPLHDEEEHMNIDQSSVNEKKGSSTPSQMVEDNLNTDQSSTSLQEVDAHLKRSINDDVCILVPTIETLTENAHLSPSQIGSLAPPPFIETQLDIDQPILSSDSISKGIAPTDKQSLKKNDHEDFIQPVVETEIVNENSLINFLKCADSVTQATQGETPFDNEKSSRNHEVQTPNIPVELLDKPSIVVSCDYYESEMSPKTEQTPVGHEENTCKTSTFLETISDLHEYSVPMATVLSISVDENQQPNPPLLSSVNPEDKSDGVGASLIEDTQFTVKSLPHEFPQGSTPLEAEFAVQVLSEDLEIDKNESLTDSKSAALVITTKIDNELPDSATVIDLLTPTTPTITTNQPVHSTVTPEVVSLVVSGSSSMLPGQPQQQQPGAPPPNHLPFSAESTSAMEKPNQADIMKQLCQAALEGDNKTVMELCAQLRSGGSQSSGEPAVKAEAIQGMFSCMGATGNNSEQIQATLNHLQGLDKTSSPPQQVAPPPPPQSQQSMFQPLSGVSNMATIAAGSNSMVTGNIMITSCNSSANVSSSVSSVAVAPSYGCYQNTAIRGQSVVTTLVGDQIQHHNQAGYVTIRPPVTTTTGCMVTDASYLPPGGFQQLLSQDLSPSEISGIVAQPTTATTSSSIGNKTPLPQQQAQLAPYSSMYCSVSSTATVAGQPLQQQASFPQQQVAPISSVMTPVRASVSNQQQSVSAAQQQYQISLPGCRPFVFTLPSKPLVPLAPHPQQPQSQMYARPPLAVSAPGAVVSATPTVATQQVPLPTLAAAQTSAPAPIATITAASTANNTPLGKKMRAIAPKPMRPIQPKSHTTNLISTADGGTIAVETINLTPGMESGPPPSTSKKKSPANKSKKKKVEPKTQPMVLHQQQQMQQLQQQQQQVQTAGYPMLQPYTSVTYPFVNQQQQAPASMAYTVQSTIPVEQQPQTMETVGDLDILSLAWQNVNSEDCLAMDSQEAMFDFSQDNMDSFLRSVDKSVTEAVVADTSSIYSAAPPALQIPVSETTPPSEGANPAKRPSKKASSSRKSENGESQIKKPAAPRKKPVNKKLKNNLKQEHTGPVEEGTFDTSLSSALGGTQFQSKPIVDLTSEVIQTVSSESSSTFKVELDVVDLTPSTEALTSEILSEISDLPPPLVNINTNKEANTKEDTSIPAASLVEDGSLPTSVVLSSDPTNCGQQQAPENISMYEVVDSMEEMEQFLQYQLQEAEESSAAGNSVPAGAELILGSDSSHQPTTVNQHDEMTDEDFLRSLEPSFSPKALAEDTNSLDKQRELSRTRVNEPVTVLAEVCQEKIEIVELSAVEAKSAVDLIVCDDGVASHFHNPVYEKPVQITHMASIENMSLKEEKTHALKSSYTLKSSSFSMCSQSRDIQSPHDVSLLPQPDIFQHVEKVEELAQQDIIPDLTSTEALLMSDESLVSPIKSSENSKQNWEKLDRVLRSYQRRSSGLADDSISSSNNTTSGGTMETNASQISGQTSQLLVEEETGGTSTDQDPAWDQLKVDTDYPAASPPHNKRVLRRRSSQRSGTLTTPNLPVLTPSVVNDNQSELDSLFSPVTRLSGGDLTTPNVPEHHPESWDELKVDTVCCPSPPKRSAPSRGQHRRSSQGSTKNDQLVTPDIPAFQQNSGDPPCKMEVFSPAPEPPSKSPASKRKPGRTKGKSRRTSAHKKHPPTESHSPSSARNLNGPASSPLAPSISREEEEVTLKSSGLFSLFDTKPASSPLFSSSQVFPSFGSLSCTTSNLAVKVDEDPPSFGRFAACLPTFGDITPTSGAEPAKKVQSNTWYTHKGALVESPIKPLFSNLEALRQASAKPRGPPRKTKKGRRGRGRGRPPCVREKPDDLEEAEDTEALVKPVLTVESADTEERADEPHLHPEKEDSDIDVGTEEPVPPHPEPLNLIVTTESPPRKSPSPGPMPLTPKSDVEGEEEEGSALQQPASPLFPPELSLLEPEVPGPPATIPPLKIKRLKSKSRRNKRHREQRKAAESAISLEEESAPPQPPQETPLEETTSVIPQEESVSLKSTAEAMSPPSPVTPSTVVEPLVAQPAPQLVPKLQLTIPRPSSGVNSLLPKKIRSAAGLANKKIFSTCKEDRRSNYAQVNKYLHFGKVMSSRRAKDPVVTSSPSPLLPPGMPPPPGLLSAGGGVAGGLLSPKRKRGRPPKIRAAPVVLQASSLPPDTLLTPSTTTPLVVEPPTVMSGPPLKMRFKLNRQEQNSYHVETSDMCTEEPSTSSPSPPQEVINSCGPGNDEMDSHHHHPRIEFMEAGEAEVFVDDNQADVERLKNRNHSRRSRLKHGDDGSGGSRGGGRRKRHHHRSEEGRVDGGGEVGENAQEECGTGERAQEGGSSQQNTSPPKKRRFADNDCDADDSHEFSSEMGMNNCHAQQPATSALSPSKQFSSSTSLEGLAVGSYQHSTAVAPARRASPSSSSSAAAPPCNKTTGWTATASCVYNKPVSTPQSNCSRDVDLELNVNQQTPVHGDPQLVSPPSSLGQANSMNQSAGTTPERHHASSANQMRQQPGGHTPHYQQQQQHQMRNRSPIKQPLSVGGVSDASPAANNNYHHSNPNSVSNSQQQQYYHHQQPSSNHSGSRDDPQQQQQQLSRPTSSSCPQQHSSELLRLPEQSIEDALPDIMHPSMKSQNHHQHPSSNKLSSSNSNKVHRVRSNTPPTAISPSPATTTSGQGGISWPSIYNQQQQMSYMDNMQMKAYCDLAHSLISQPMHPYAGLPADSAAFYSQLRNFSSPVGGGHPHHQSGYSAPSNGPWDHLYPGHGSSMAGYPDYSGHASLQLAAAHHMFQSYNNSVGGGNPGSPLPQELMSLGSRPGSVSSTPMPMPAHQGERNSISGVSGVGGGAPSAHHSVFSSQTASDHHRAGFSMHNLP